MFEYKKKKNDENNFFCIFCKIWYKNKIKSGIKYL